MKALNRWMRASGISQSQLARLMECDRYQVNRWVRGVRRPSIDTLRRIQKATGLTLKELSRGL